MDIAHEPGCCGCRGCGCGSSAEVRRRTFLAASAVGVTGALLPVTVSPATATTATATAAEASTASSAELVPASLQQLSDRGVPTQYQGAALARIGMPVGGITCGQVYLSGDGRLWVWDIFNPNVFPLGGADCGGTHYVAPMTAGPDTIPFKTGFVLRTEAAGVTRTRALDATGFPDVRFIGRYPIGTTTFRAADSPVDITLDAFSPFIPLATDDSSYPAVVMAYRLKNTSHRTVRATIAGFSENPVCNVTASQQITRLRSTAVKSGQARFIDFSAADAKPPAPGERADVIIEDWSKDDFAGWTVTGTAFGSGPVGLDDVAAGPANFRRFGDLNLTNGRFVSSFNWRGGGDPDQYTGSLLSAPFPLARHHVAVAVGGGNHPGITCVDVLVDGEVIASATGRDSEPLVAQTLDVSAYEGRTAQIRINDQHTAGWGHLNCGAIVLTDDADILFEDWSTAGFGNWTVTGTAFGPGPVRPDELPEFYRRAFGEITDLNVSGERFVTSFNFRVADADGPTGSLTSPEFVISRRFVTAWVGGGGHRDQTAVQVLVDNQVVASCNGQEIEPMQAISMDVGKYLGRAARIRIVDSRTDGWGHVNCDRISFSNRPVRADKVANRYDGGGFALAAFDPAAVVRPSIADWSTPAAVLDSAPGPQEVEGSKLAGTVSTTVTLRPGESTTMRFAFGWFFPRVGAAITNGLQGGSTLRRHYSTRFDGARDVIESLAARLDRLEGQTRTWVETFYDDSTLPHWFCERTLANASTLATGTCYRFDNGRFYGFEGIYSCVGTCQHVWSYAQSVARLFPELERDTRERVDLGLALRPNGEMQNRGEWENSFIDGQCGTILRIYREHQMSPDGEFLARVWPKVRLAVDFLVNNRDVDSDGVIEGSQWNTLDSEWFGEVPWISGLYVAALRAAAAMAVEVGDTASAGRYAVLADRGSAFIDSTLWDAGYGYYVHRVDPNHPANMNSNRGVYIDQLYGQTYAGQLGLPRVFAAEKAKVALSNIYRNSFLADSSNYSRVSGIGGGRVYSVAGEPGVVMSSWPNGGANEAGSLGALIYFNEVWTGQEHQLAANLMAEGLVAESLAVTRAVHERYHGSKRNPYNEIECGDHYARGMMSHAVFLAACGYEHHGPKAHLGFAPKLTPESFRAAFTTAGGWGLYRQTRKSRTQTAVVEVRFGQVEVATFSQQTVVPARSVVVKVGGRRVAATLVVEGERAVVRLARRAVLKAGQALEVTLQ